MKKIKKNGITIEEAVSDLIENQEEIIEKLGEKTEKTEKKWKPEEGDDYWYIEIDGTVKKLVWYGGYDSALILKHTNNVFRTKEEAEEYGDKFKELLKGRE